MRVVVASVVAWGVVVSSHPALADDVQLWTEAGAKQELGDRFAVTLDQHLRFDEDLTRVAAIMPELGVHAQLGPVRTSAGYRLEYERDRDGELVVRHRFHAAARTRFDLDTVAPVAPIRLEHRLQIQEQLRPASMDRLRHSVRNRFEVAYRGIRRWSIAGSVELFHDLARDDQTIYLDKSWFTLGVARRKGRTDTEAFYRLELPHYDPRDPIAHIIGAAFHLDL